MIIGAAGAVVLRRAVIDLHLGEHGVAGGFPVMPTAGRRSDTATPTSGEGTVQ